MQVIINVEENGHTTINLGEGTPPLVAIGVLEVAKAIILRGNEPKQSIDESGIVKE